MRPAALWLAFLLLFGSPASAEGIESIYFDIDLNGAPRESISIIAGNGTSPITLSLPAAPENLFVSHQYELVGGNEIIVKPPQNESSQISISFESRALAAKISGTEYLLTFSYTAPSDVKDFRLGATLPEGAAVSEKGGLLVSRPVSISTDGSKIFLEWGKSLKEGEQFSAFVQYNARPAQDGMILPAFVIIFLLAGLAIGYKIRQFKKSKFIKEVVSEDERKIVDEIMNKGEIMQDELRDKTNFSKTKISKVVRNLEAKGIIRKLPFKKTNKLRMK